MSGHYLYDTDALPRLSKSYQNILAGPAELLQTNVRRLVQKWTELYLLTFGRKAFFSHERVEKVLDDMAGIFISSIKNSNFNYYFDTLSEKGKFFSKLGVPFEEIILCLQLFEEAYLSILLEDKTSVPRNVKEILLAFEEFNNISTAVFAVSYFRTVKKSWKDSCEGYQEENERLRKELQNVQDELFTSTRSGLNSMELMLSGINRKLRKSVVQSRRLQKFAEVLDKEPNLKNLLKMADKFMKQILPPDSEVLFGLFDENQRKLSLYAAMDAQAYPNECPQIVDEIFFSELPLEYQETLFNEFKNHVAVQERKVLPHFLANIERFNSGKNFLFLPLKKYRDALGFLFISAPEENLFTKTSVKYYQRMARTLSNAIFSTMYFNRHKKHSEFISMLHQIEDRVLQRHSLETTLDYCLGALIDLLDVERASLMLMDKKNRSLSLYAAKGYRVYPFSGLTLKWGEGIAGWSIKEGRVISIPRMRNHSDNGFLHKVPLGGVSSVQLNVRSLLCVPLADMNEPLGVINLSTISYYKNFEQSEIDMINQFAQRISQALKSLATMKDLELYMQRVPRRG